MLAACALFAFEHPGVEMDDMALLGALLKAEERAVSIAHAENFAEWVKAWVKSKKSGRGGGRGRKR
jgi:hypothetical protein